MTTLSRKPTGKPDRLIILAEHCKTDFYWFDSWKYWRLGRHVAESGQLSEQYVFSFYSHALECLLASVFLPANTIRPTIDATKFLGLALFFLELLGVFALVQVYLKPRVSRSIAYTGGIVVLCFYSSAPMVIYHSLLIVHETLAIPLLISLLVISAKVKTHTSMAYQSLLIVYVSLFWTTSALMLLVVSMTMILQWTYRCIRKIGTQRNHIRSPAWRWKSNWYLKRWKTWLVVAFFVIYPLLSIVNSLGAIYYDIDRFLLNTSGANLDTSNQTSFGVLDPSNLINILVNSTGIIGTGVVICLGILLPRYWKYLKFSNSAQPILQFVYWLYYLGLVFGLFWNFLPFRLFMGQFRLGLYAALAGSIIVGVSTGCFLQFATERIVNTKIRGNYLSSSFLKNAEMIVIMIILIQVIYGISLSSQIFMWENVRPIAYGSSVLPIGTP